MAAVTWDTLSTTLSTDLISGLTTATLPTVAGAAVIQGVRAWYADGSVHDTKTETWGQFPATGLQIAMIYLTQTWDANGLKPYRLSVMGQDLYQTDDSL